MRIQIIQKLIDKIRGKNTDNKVPMILSTRLYQNNTERVLNVFFHDEQGIANRIKCLFSHLRIYNGLYDTVDLYWPLKKMSSNSFFELFNFNYFTRINEINHSIYTDYGFQGDITWRLVIKKGELNSDFSKAFRQDDKNIPCIDFEYSRIPENIINLYRPYFIALKPSEAVQKIIDSVVLPQKCVSVHIRHDKEWRRYNRWAENDIQMFIDEMNKYDNDTYFYLACCDNNVREQLLDKFKNRIIEIPNKEIGRTDNFQDIAELYLLSKNKTLIGTYGSTFTEVAWWLSGCKQHVTIIGNYNNWSNKGMA